MSEPAIELPKEHANEHANQRLTLWLLAFATLLAAGTPYYSQPLLIEIANSFHASHLESGMIPTLTQIGYVAGLIFITPLGDVLEKRRLIVVLLSVNAVALLSGALVPAFFLFALVAVGIGLSAVVVQIMIPFAASISAPRERAKNLGVILSAALIGILFSRTLSGFIGARFGWRAVYEIGAAVLFALAIAIQLILPLRPASTRLKYHRLLASIWTLARDLPELRRIAVIGAFCYASLCAFWTSLAFYLHDQYSWGPGVAGSFGLLGAIGALSAQLAGRNAERLGARRLVRASIAVMILSFVIMGFFGGNIVGLVLGVLLLDLGAQTATVSNQSEIYRLHDQAQTRLNTIYKMFYFVGGSLGSFASALAWEHWKWPGVCVFGVLMLIGAALVSRRREHKISV